MTCSWSRAMASAVAPSAPANYEYGGKGSEAHSRFECNRLASPLRRS